MKTNYFITLLLLCGIVLNACTEIEYHEIEEPAYLRVFNNLNYEIRLENRHEQVPYLTMLIDPVFDENGVPVSAAITGDFLDKRERYAAPFPTHSAGSTTRNNPEYPGKENVLVGPVLNGFDLSSWAQVPAGRHRIMFFFRPVNEIPFFALTPDLRQSVVAEAEIDLQQREIYTLHVVQKDYTTKENGIILRQENFHKQPFSDSLVYVNFYNMSAKGFVDAEDLTKPSGMSTLQYGIQDKMNVYVSLYPQTATQYRENTAIPGFYAKFLYSLERNTGDGTVNPYFSFPLFADTTKTVTTNMVQHIAFMAPGMNFVDITIGGQSTPKGLVSHLIFYDNGITSLPGRANAARFPSMFINTHSGVYNPKSFSAVNTIEVVNGEAYLTTIQRKYDPPIY